MFVVKSIHHKVSIHCIVWLEVVTLSELAASCIVILAGTSEGLAGLRVLEETCNVR